MLVTVADKHFGWTRRHRALRRFLSDFTGFVSFELPVDSQKAEATVALSSAPSDPLLAMLEMLAWSAED